MSHPLVLLLFLTGLVSGILWLEKRPFLKKIVHFLPAPFWCYFVPVTLASAGFLPSTSPVYSFLTTYVLGACLILLLVGVQISAIARVGPTALAAMVTGMFGIGLGAVLSYAILGRFLPPEAWKGVGALSASWTGGSANMLAVKEALSMSDSALAPFVIVDTVMTYAWMGILIALAPFQEAWNRLVGADETALQDSLRRLEQGARAEAASKSPPSFVHEVLLLAAGLALAWGCLWLAGHIPWRGNALSATGWAFILASVLGVLLSFSPASRLERYGASRVGYFCLYLLLAAIGSRAHFQDIAQTPVLLLLALILVMVHALSLMLYGYWKRIPLFFLVTASQANIGGTASAPIVAGLYQPRLAPLGLILAIALNTIGTYVGLLIAQACHWAHF